MRLRKGEMSKEGVVSLWNNNGSSHIKAGRYCSQDTAWLRLKSIEWLEF
jgi:hypothetical protein